MFRKLLNKEINLNSININFSINPHFTKNVFISLFLFFSLMPYVSPLPLGSDVQIVTGLIGYFILFILMLNNKFYMNKMELLIFSFTLFFLFYFNTNDDTYQFRKAIGPLYGFGIFYVTKYYKKYFNIKIINIVLGIYLLSSIVQLISPQLFNLTFENFIRVAKYSSASGRGITSMAPEPGFLGIVAVYILVIQDWFYKSKELDKMYYYRFIICSFLVVSSMSGAGYILLFLFIIYKLLKYFKKYWWIFSFLFIISTITIGNIKSVDGNKGLSDLIGVLKSTSPRALLGVSSLSNRVNPIIVSFYGAYEKPLGRGNGSYTSEAKEVYLKYNIDKIYPPHVRDRLLYEISIDSVSTFGKYFFEYGLFFILFLIIIISNVNFKKMGLFTVFLLFTGLMFSLPIVYPPLWLMLGLYSKI